MIILQKTSSDFLTPIYNAIIANKKRVDLWDPNESLGRLRPDVFFGFDPELITRENCGILRKCKTYFVNADPPEKIETAKRIDCDELVDDTMFLDLPSRVEYNCDIGILCLEPRTKQKIFTITTLLKDKYKIKVLGDHPMDIPEYLGRVPQEEMVEFWRSCQLVLTFNNLLKKELQYFNINFLNVSSIDPEEIHLAFGNTKFFKSSVEPPKTVKEVIGPLC